MHNIELKFDRGTLVLDGVRDQIARDAVPQGIVWDERTKNFRGPGYLYRRAMSHFEKHKLDVVDCVATGPRFKIDPWREISLYEYQAAACQLWRGNGDKGVIVLPTGAGKTRIAASLIAEVRKPTLILVPTRALLHQWQTALKEFYQGPIGTIGDGECSMHGITVSTIASAFLKMKQIGNVFDLLIVDEAHHFGKGITDEALLMSTATKRLGLTASFPNESAHASRLEALLGAVVISKGIGDLSGEYLSDFDYLRVPIHLNAEEKVLYKATYGEYQSFARQSRWCWEELGWDAFRQFALKSDQGKRALWSAQRARQLVNLSSTKKSILEKLLKQHWNQRVFVFVASAGDAYDIAKLGHAYPIVSAIGRAEREVVLEKFAKNEIRALVACKVLNEGIDVPAAEVAIIVGGSSNPREHIQRVGRVLRKAPGKRAIVYELVTLNTFEVSRSRRRSFNHN